MARMALLEAEQRVIQMLRTRCGTGSSARRAAPAIELLLRAANYPAYMEQIVDTVPDDLDLVEFMRTTASGRRAYGPGSPLPAPSIALRPSDSSRRAPAS